ncbi:MAG: hypothetical protein WEA58_03870 [Balneolaceae bacterium]
MSSTKSLKKLTPEATIDQIITADKNVASLLNSIGMKPELYQDQTLRSVCLQRQWNEEELLKWIKKNRKNEECIKSEPQKHSIGEDVTGWCRWLATTIQPCITDLLDDIESDLPRVQLVHGNQYIWLKDIEWHFLKLKKQTDRYFFLEEETLYPLAIELNDQRESILYGKVKDLSRSLEIVEGDYPIILKEMEIIEKFSEGFKNPEGACSTLRIMNKNLADLSTQLKKYFSIEQKQLFPLIRHQLQFS